MPWGKERASLIILPALVGRRVWGEGARRKEHLLSEKERGFLSA